MSEHNLSAMERRCSLCKRNSASYYRCSGKTCFMLVLFANLFVGESGSKRGVASAAPWLSPMHPYKLRRIPFCDTDHDCSAGECCVLDYSNNMPLSLGGLPAVYKRCQPLATTGQTCSRATLLQVRHCGCARPLACELVPGKTKTPKFFKGDDFEKHTPEDILFPLELSNNHNKRRMLPYSNGRITSRHYQIPMMGGESQKFETTVRGYNKPAVQQKPIDVEGICVMPRVETPNENVTKTRNSRQPDSWPKYNPTMQNYMMEVSLYDQIANRGKSPTTNRLVAQSDEQKVGDKLPQLTSPAEAAILAALREQEQQFGVDATSNKRQLKQQLPEDEEFDDIFGSDLTTEQFFASIAAGGGQKSSRRTSAPNQLPFLNKDNKNAWSSWAQKINNNAQKSNNSSQNISANGSVNGGFATEGRPPTAPRPPGFIRQINAPTEGTKPRFSLRSNARPPGMVFKFN